MVLAGLNREEQMRGAACRPNPLAVDANAHRDIAKDSELLLLDQIDQCFAGVDLKLGACVARRQLEPCGGCFTRKLSRGYEIGVLSENRQRNKKQKRSDRKVSSNELALHLGISFLTSKTALV